MAFTRTYSARTDSGSANNPALNLTGASAQSLTFVNESISGESGDMYLDSAGDGTADPDTLVQIDGVSYEFVFELSGTLPTTKNNGSQQVPDQFEGDPVYIITVLDYPSSGETTRFAFMPEESVTLANMDAFGNGAIDVQNTNYTPPASPVCFAEGTMIATPGGERAVETLRQGDTVLTAGGARRQIRWISWSEHSWSAEPDRHKPILIRAGALGKGQPARDLVVSPQHRVAIAGDAGPVLAPAIGLTGLPGIRQMRGRRAVHYFHVLLERHDLLLADGLAAESFYPGPAAVAMLTPGRQAELACALRDLTGPGGDYGPLALPCLTRREAERRVRARPSDAMPEAA